jgi:5,6-dimethylbenzimidazole synthase
MSTFLVARFEPLDEHTDFSQDGTSLMENESMSRDEYDQLLDLVKKRRTIRKFRPDPLPEGCVEKIIEIARWAPSGFHTQPWEFVVVKKKEVRDAIVQVLDRHAPPITKLRPGDPVPAASRGSFRDAPVFIVLLADWRAKVGLPGHPTENNAVVTSIYHSSLASAFLYLHLAAASLGLASQWYSAASRPEAESEIRKIIGFPESLTLYDMMVLGYPAAPPNRKDLRDLSGMIHYDDCGPGDFRTDAEVIADARKTWEWCMSEH